MSNLVNTSFLANSTNSTNNIGFFANPTNSTNNGFLANPTNSTNTGFLANPTNPNNSSILANLTNPTNTNFLANPTNSTSINFPANPTNSTSVNFPANPTNPTHICFHHVNPTNSTNAIDLGPLAEPIQDQNSPIQRRKSKGRQKIEMKKMTNESNLQVTFSKRRTGLFKKASELCTLCGAEVALIVFSPGDKAFSFGHPNVDSTINRFLNRGAHHRNISPASLQIMEAHRSANVRELNNQLTQLMEQLDLEKKRSNELNRHKHDLESVCWWVNPEANLTKDQMVTVKGRLEDLKKTIAREADRLLIQTAANAQFYVNNCAAISQPPPPVAPQSQLFPPPMAAAPAPPPPQMFGDYRPVMPSASQMMFPPTPPPPVVAPAPAPAPVPAPAPIVQNPGFDASMMMPMEMPEATTAAAMPGQQMGVETSENNNMGGFFGGQNGIFF